MHSDLRILFLLLICDIVLNFSEYYTNVKQKHRKDKIEFLKIYKFVVWMILQNNEKIANHFSKIYYEK